MTNRAQNILIFVFMLVVIGMVVIWFYVLNEGKLIVTTGTNNYTIHANKQSTLCSDDPCEIKLKIGRYTIGFEKDGYNSSSSQTSITRGGVSVVKFEAKKKMEIKPSSVIPTEDDAELPAPNDLNADDIIGSVWNATNDRFLFLDKSDSRLKIRESNREIKLITTLKNVLPPIDFYWSSDENHILANKDEGIYFIEIEMGSRKKQALNFLPSYVTWPSANDFILLNDDNNALYKINWSDPENIEKMDVDMDLEKSVWINESILVTYKIDSERNQTEIWSFNLINFTKESLAQKFDFPIDEIKYDSEQNTVHFRHEREENWYEMKM